VGYEMGLEHDGVGVGPSYKLCWDHITCKTYHKRTLPLHRCH